MAVIGHEISATWPAPIGGVEVCVGGEGVT